MDLRDELGAGLEIAETSTASPLATPGSGPLPVVDKGPTGTKSLKNSSSLIDPCDEVGAGLGSTEKEFRQGELGM
ncbi:hypothetical protein LTR17_009460 [Elasticomyces elasticus]|nr:hypothetical protein LTR17_009460 [Elasticomyces elasticus]